MRKFCDLCDNMYYITLRGGGSADGADAGSGAQAPRLTYTCKHCGNIAEDDEGAEGNGVTCVMFTNYTDDQTVYKQYTTPYIKYDMTLPRVTNIVCPAKDCTRPAAAEQRVIYVKYDPTSLKYLYYCDHCGAFWKSGDSEPTRLQTNVPNVPNVANVPNESPPEAATTPVS